MEVPKPTSSLIPVGLGKPKLIRQDGYVKMNFPATPTASAPAVSNGAKSPSGRKTKVREQVKARNKATGKTTKIQEALLDQKAQQQAATDVTRAKSRDLEAKQVELDAMVKSLTACVGAIKDGALKPQDPKVHLTRFNKPLTEFVCKRQGKLVDLFDKLGILAPTKPGDICSYWTQHQRTYTRKGEMDVKPSKGQVDDLRRVGALGRNKNRDYPQITTWDVDTSKWYSFHRQNSTTLQIAETVVAEYIAVEGLHFDAAKFDARWDVYAVSINIPYNSLLQLREHTRQFTSDLIYSTIYEMYMKDEDFQPDPSRASSLNLFIGVICVLTIITASVSCLLWLNVTSRSALGLGILSTIYWLYRWARMLMGAWSRLRTLFR